MRRIAAVCVLLMACSVVVVSQEYPKAEVFGGFQYTRVDLFNVQGANLMGWNAQGTYYLNKPFGITAEVTGSYGSPTVGGIGTSLPTYTYLFGPTLRAPLSRTTPFVHALFGAAHMSNTKGVYSSTGFGLALGGGFDTKVSRNFDWRVVQVDYLTTKLKDPTGTGNDRQDHFRLATGLVFKF